MPDEELKAKVFISCGQRPDLNEEKIAKEIEKKLCCLGYEPYLALREQSPRSVREEIFDELKTSEYFLFIDFKREQLNCGEFHRGSLFTNQELAIASYLELPIVAFQEEGVLERDGVMSCMQLNLEIGSTRFTERDTLVERVIDKIKDKWDPHWKNGLCLKSYREQYTGRQTPGEPIHFHIGVKNQHHCKSAINCQVYLERVHDFQTDEDRQYGTTDVKWAGHRLPTLTILPSLERRFDAFYMWRNEANSIHSSDLADHDDFRWEICGPGKFQLTYVVVSDNFPPARIKCNLYLPKDLEDWEHMRFKQIDPPP